MCGLTVLPLYTLKKVCSGQAGQNNRSFMEVTFQKENDKGLSSYGDCFKESLIFL